MESYKKDVESLIRSALMEGGVEVLLSDIDERAQRLRGRMDAINDKFASAKEYNEETRVEVNDEAIADMVDLMSSMDALKVELVRLQVSDPNLKQWKKHTEKTVDALAKEIEAGS